MQLGTFIVTGLLAFYAILQATMGTPTDDSCFSRKVHPIVLFTVTDVNLYRITDTATVILLKDPKTDRLKEMKIYLSPNGENENGRDYRGHEIQLLSSKAGSALIIDYIKDIQKDGPKVLLARSNLAGMNNILESVIESAGMQAKFHNHVEAFADLDIALKIYAKSWTESIETDSSAAETIYRERIQRAETDLNRSFGCDMNIPKDVTDMRKDYFLLKNHDTLPEYLTNNGLIPLKEFKRAPTESAEIEETSESESFEEENLAYVVQKEENSQQDEITASEPLKETEKVEEDDDSKKNSSALHPQENSKIEEEQPKQKHSAVLFSVFPTAFKDRHFIQISDVEAFSDNPRGGTYFIEWDKSMGIKKDDQFPLPALPDVVTKEKAMESFIEDLKDIAGNDHKIVLTTYMNMGEGTNLVKLANITNQYDTLSNLVSGITHWEELTTEAPEELLDDFNDAMADIPAGKNQIENYLQVQEKFMKKNDMKLTVEDIAKTAQDFEIYNQSL